VTTEAEWRAAGLDTSRPFSRAQAMAAGIKDSTLRGPRFRRLHNGVYGAAEVELTGLVRAQAALVPFGGRAFARAAARYVRARVRSPMESRTRMLLVLAGLPEPEVNALVRAGNGSMREHDLLYRAARTVIEYDGRQHARDTRQWRIDLQRREDVDDDGWRVLVLTAEDIYRHPADTLRRVQDLLIRRGQPDVPRMLLDEWRRSFPGRG